MALRLRRDVQKASYYLWFLGAEEAKGLRGARVINAALPYLIDRSHSQEPLKITLQVSHKGIKILQGSSKHFIPHSAITSSVQIDDIVACVLLLYNPTTKCPLHVHAYRCDSESTAEALNHQLQTLINRSENQKRFEELETRLGIKPGNHMPAALTSSSHPSSKELMSSKSPPPALASAAASSSVAHYEQKDSSQRRQAQGVSPKRLGSSLGSDTGNSTRESDCSEELPSKSHSPLIAKSSLPPPAQCTELFDSLAAELRAKLNGNGPPILLPPRDYDTVHRSKGNLTAIELRRCRNSLIVGGTTAAGAATATALNAKQVSSRGSSGIGSDLAPSPERQELNSSSDDEHWSNEADNSVIALKPSQIAMEQRAEPLISQHHPHPHPQLNRRNAAKPSEDGYLRDLPAKPYVPTQERRSNSRDKNRKEGLDVLAHENDKMHHSASQAHAHAQASAKSPSMSSSWSREDEIKPIIMRPADYEAKFSRVLDQNHDYRGERGERGEPKDVKHSQDVERMRHESRYVEHRSPERYKYKSEQHGADEVNELRGSQPPPANYRRDPSRPLHKPMEAAEHYPGYKRHTETQGGEERAERYERGYDGYSYELPPPPAPAPAPMAGHNKYAAVHRGVSHMGGERERERDRDRERERQRSVPALAASLEKEMQQREKSREREHLGEEPHARNPYREPESIPYIKSMEKMMKSCAIRYNSFENISEPLLPQSTAAAAEAKFSQHGGGSMSAASSGKAHHQHQHQHQQQHQRQRSDDDYKPHRDGYAYKQQQAASSSSAKEYAPSTTRSVSPRGRSKEAKEITYRQAAVRAGYEPRHEREMTPTYPPEYKYRMRGGGGGSGSGDMERSPMSDMWSNEERPMERPPSAGEREAHLRSLKREHWKPTAIRGQRPEKADGYAYRDQPPPHAHRKELPSGMHEESSYKRSGSFSESPHEHRSMGTPPSDYHHREVRHRESSSGGGGGGGGGSGGGGGGGGGGGSGYREPYSYQHREHRNYSPDGGERRRQEMPRDRGHPHLAAKASSHHSDMYPIAPPSSQHDSPPLVNAKSLSNLTKGYRNSYADPVFVRSGGRVGLAAVNPY